MDAGDRELFGATLTEVVGRHRGAELDTQLDALGWSDALADDPEAAVGLLFEAQGRANATSSALDRVLGAALGRPDLPVVLPALGRTDPPGTDRVHGLGSSALAGATAVLVVTGSGDSSVLAEAAAGALECRAVAGVDPALGLVEVDGPVPADGEILAPGVWADAVAAGQRALAHELVGVSSAMLALARDHALERVQFGVPIASFQAVRHRLAESLVAVEAARAVADAAWLEPSPATARLAKAVAGRSARTVGRHAQQVLAGIGFTTEHPFHHHLRRALVLDRLLGASRLLTRELGEDLLAARRLPPLVAL